MQVGKRLDELDGAAPGQPGAPFGLGAPAGDHRQLARWRLGALLGMLLLLLPVLAGLGYDATVGPVLAGLGVLLAATALGYLRGRRRGDWRGAWLFYAGADALVILVLALQLGLFIDVFLLVVIVELARIYRHGRLVILGGVTAAALVGLQAALLLAGFGPAGAAAQQAAGPTILLALALITVALLTGVSLATFISHYAREIFSYERIQAVNAAELHVAHEIQMGLLAPGELQSGPWHIAALSIPAKEVGGDFYEYVPAPGSSIGGIAIGDVSGKGIPAALQMAVVRTIFRIEARRRILPAETLMRVNQSLQTEMPQGMVTLLYAFVDPLAGVMHYANAGHNYPILINGRVRELVLPGLPLGIDAEVEYQERAVIVEPGTSVLFYTDGVVEAVNAQGEMFSFERLFNLLDRHRHLASKALVHRIVNEVQDFTGPIAQADDITVVVLQRGAGSAPDRG